MEWQWRVLPQLELARKPRLEKYPLPCSDRPRQAAKRAGWWSTWGRRSVWAAFGQERTCDHMWWCRPEPHFPGEGRCSLFGPHPNLDCMHGVCGVGWGWGTGQPQWRVTILLFYFPFYNKLGKFPERVLLCAFQRHLTPSCLAPPPPPFSLTYQGWEIWKYGNSLINRTKLNHVAEYGINLIH